MENSMVNKIWAEMCTTTNIHLLQFKILSHLQKIWTLNAGISEFIPKKKHLKFQTLHSPFCPFFIKILKLNHHPEYFGVYFSLWNLQMRFIRLRVMLSNRGYISFIDRLGTKESNKSANTPGTPSHWLVDIMHAPVSTPPPCIGLYRMPTPFSQLYTQWPPIFAFSIKIFLRNHHCGACPSHLTRVKSHASQEPVRMLLNPRLTCLTKLFFVTRLTKGGCYNPLPRFSKPNRLWNWFWYQKVGMVFITICQTVT